MIVITNEFTASGNKEGFESLPQIVNSLSAGPSNVKKVRHSLKNLCFYPPSATVLNPLIDQFKHQLKDQTKCFKLLCHHLITHAPLASSSSQTGDFINTLSKTICDMKKPAKSIGDLYRVFFYFCFYTPSMQPMLIDTISKIITVDLSFLTKKKKKNKLLGSSHKSHVPELILECVQLLVEIPNFETSVRDLFQKEGIVDGFINIYKSFGMEYKRSILTFLSNIKSDSQIVQVPPPLLDIINPEDNIIDNISTANYLINHHEKFSTQIISILEKKNVPSTNLLQYRLLLKSGPSQVIYDSIAAQIEPQECNLLPLLKFLEKSPRGTVSPEVERTLYAACQDNNITLALISFMCVCFISDETDWICNFFVDTMKKLSHTARFSLVLMLTRSWVEALDHPENKTFVRALFEKLIMEFGDCIDQKIYNAFLEKVIQSGCTDDFMEVFRDALEKLPSIESVIYILFGASTLRQHADPSIFAEFLEVAKVYMETAGPAMLSFYEMTLAKSAAD
ncbi:hypothetical protein TRFO_08132 [Tritrichomonas foetus]|uniref:Uncharacterized protein n=1 Tax=Tritrichomonas foetus TaxID=1144522 RepID=A0A1J4JSB8_9EUKA|nr:hypothetical protein TRFO_08132 [Tritrichomonas foetus]|eukprot:OHT00133.1 hypothetical protein TRFO_08132 [Tritrichomonas foetus]